MRPGNRWNGEAANPLAAAFYGAVLALVIAYLFCFVLGRTGFSLLHGPGGWFSPQYLMRSAVSLYAAQHVPLIGFGTVGGELGSMEVHASLTLPLTLCALVPMAALMIGGYAAAKSRGTCPRWAAIVPALFAGLIYTMVLVIAARFVAAGFTSVGLPEVISPTMSTQFNPPQVPFRPSISGTFTYCIVFGLIFPYLGALLAVRSSGEPKIAGKWWACTKATIALGLVIQLTVAGAAMVWSYRSDVISDYTRREFVGILPTVAGIGYSMVYGSKLSLGMESAAVRSSAYHTDAELYLGVVSMSAGKPEYKPANPNVYFVALVAALLVLFSGRLAVRYGSRDGSLPTAVRMTMIQFAFIALQMMFCTMSFSTGGLTAYMRPAYGGAMLLAGVGIFMLTLLGAHWANTRYVGRLSGFPTA